MRRYVLGMVMAAFIFAAMLPVQASAGEEINEDKDGREDKAWINCVSEDNETVVSVHLPGATEKRIATFRLKLHVDDEPEVVFTDEAKRRARVCESRYNSETNILSIYLSASRSSVDYPVFNNDSLTVCRLTVADSEGNPVDTGAKLADSEDAFRIVCGKEAVNMALEDRTGTPLQNPDNGSAGASQTGKDIDGVMKRDGILPYIVIGAAGIAVIIAVAAIVYRRHSYFSHPR